MSLSIDWKLEIENWKIPKGFTLIELLIGLGVFLVIAGSLYVTVQQLLRAAHQARIQTAATAVANEELELIRNLSYADIGIVGGIPQGILPRNETVTRNDVVFTITRTIRTIDDPFDGTVEGSPPDTAPADYKLADVSVQCDFCSAAQTVRLSTIIAPKYRETETKNGTLIISVIDTEGAPIAGADVHIENQKLNPNLVIDETTDAQGLVQLFDVPPSVGGYAISVTKQEYSSDKTYTPGGSENPNPEKSDSTVRPESVTKASFIIDRLSSLTINTRDDRDKPIGSVTLSLFGTKTIGKDMQQREIKKIERMNVQTNPNGTFRIDPLEWDTYLIAPDDDTQFDIAGSNPILPIDIQPGTKNEITLTLVSKTSHSLLVTVYDIQNALLNNARVTLIDAQGKKGKTIVTNTQGQAFFTDIQAGDYTLEIAKSGFLTTITDPFPIEGTEAQHIVLLPIE